MKIKGQPYRTIWLNSDGWSVEVIDQTLLPHRFATRTLRSAEDADTAIRTMVVRGAPLIGATAAYGLALAMRDDPSDARLSAAHDALAQARPTAINLKWALARLREPLQQAAPHERSALAYRLAAELCDEDVAINEAIGAHGLEVFRARWRSLGERRPLQVLTHCNAGWLATVDWGTALAPIYRFHDERHPVHVFVDETRPRNQGAALTAYELAGHGVPHTLIVDNAGGHLMQRGDIDLVIVGTDRVCADGSVCNKIGTYLKALAAHDNDVPFYVALPSPTIDWSTARGADVPIEDRGAREVTHISGRDAQGAIVEVALAPETSHARNPGFDVTPPRLVTGLITERGVAKASREGMSRLFPARDAA